jgi:hypothetical protein
MGPATPQVSVKVYAYGLEDDTHGGRAAVADIAAKSMSCAPNVHSHAAGHVQNAARVRSRCGVIDVPRVGFEPTLDRV